MHRISAGIHTWWIFLQTLPQQFHSAVTSNRIQELKRPYANEATPRYSYFHLNPVKASHGQRSHGAKIDTWNESPWWSVWRKRTNRMTNRPLWEPTEWEENVGTAEKLLVSSLHTHYWRSRCLNPHPEASTATTVKTAACRMMYKITSATFVEPPLYQRACTGTSLFRWTWTVNLVKNVNYGTMHFELVLLKSVLAGHI